MPSHFGAFYSINTFDYTVDGHNHKTLPLLEKELHKQAKAKGILMTTTLDTLTSLKGGRADKLDVATQQDTLKPWNHAVLRKPLRRLRDFGLFVSFLFLGMPYFILTTVAKTLLGKTFFESPKRKPTKLSHKVLFKETKKPSLNKEASKAGLMLEALKRKELDIVTGEDKNDLE
jgi:hypothetical protein